MGMECTSHALARSTGTRDKEREQAEDTGVGVSFRGGWVMVLAPGLPHSILAAAFPPQHLSTIDPKAQLPVINGSFLAP